MNCKNCNAVMVANKEKRMFVCPYCDSTEPFDGMSNQELRDELKGIVSEAIRDANMSDGGASKGNGNNDKRSAARKARDGAISGLQVIACIFLAFFSVTIFTDDFRIVGFISLVQMLLLIVTLVNKAKYHKTGDEKAHKRAKICVIAASLLIIVWFAVLLMENNGTTGGKAKNWPEAGYGSELPVMPGTLDYVYSSKSGFNATSKNTDASDFVAYMKECKEAGYDIDAEETDRSYLAYDEDDNKLEIRYSEYSNRLDVTLDKGIVMTDFQWYNQGIAGELPEPKAKQSCLKTLRNGDYDRFEIYVGDMTREEFQAYVNECVANGFVGQFDAAMDVFRGKKEMTGTESKAGKKVYVHINLEFQRGRILYIEAYTSDI